MRLSVSHKLIVFSTLVILVVSSGFTWVNLFLARRAIEEDLKARAIVYAREVAASIGSRADLESGPALRRMIARLIEIRRSVLQLDVLRFRPDGTTVVATNEPNIRLPFSRRDAEEVQKFRVVSRAVSGREPHWEVMAPITLEGVVVGWDAGAFSAQGGEVVGRRMR